MARAAKRPILILLACIAAAAFVVSPVAGAERLAMVTIPAENPVVDRALTLSLGGGAAVSRVPFHKGGGAHGLFGSAQFSPAATGKRRAGKALRIDLFHFQVTRPAVDDRPAGSSGWVLPSVVHVNVKRGATPGSKAIGVEMPVAPNVVVESRLRPGGASDTGIRFKIHY